MAGDSTKLRRGVPARPKRARQFLSSSSTSTDSDSRTSLSHRSSISTSSKQSIRSDRLAAPKKTRKPKRASSSKRAKTVVRRKSSKRPAQRRAISETRKSNARSKSTTLVTLKDEKDSTLREIFHDVVAELMTRKGQNTTLHYSASEVSLASERPSLGSFPALDKAKSHRTSAQSWMENKLTPSATSTHSRSSLNRSAATRSSFSRGSVAQKFNETKSPLKQAQDGKKNVSFFMYGPEHARWMKKNEDVRPIIPRDIRPPSYAINGMFRSQLAKYRTAAEMKKDEEKAAAALKAPKEFDKISGNDDPGWYESAPIAGPSKAAAPVDQSAGVASVNLAPAVQPAIVQPVASTSGAADKTAASVNLALASQATLVSMAPSMSPALPESPAIVGSCTEVLPKPIVRKRSDSFQSTLTHQNAQIKRIGVSQQLERFGVKMVSNESKNTAVELSDRTSSPIPQESTKSPVNSEKVVSPIALAHAASPVPLKSPGPRKMNNNGSPFVPLAHSTPMSGSSDNKPPEARSAYSNGNMATSDIQLPPPVVRCASLTSPIFKTPSRSTSSKWLVKVAETIEEAHDQGKQIVLSPHVTAKSVSPAAAQVANNTFASPANISASSQGTFWTPGNVSAPSQDHSPTLVTALDTSSRSNTTNISNAISNTIKMAEEPTTSGVVGAGRFKHKKNIHLCMMVEEEKPIEADYFICFESSYSKPSIRITQLYVDDEPMWSTRKDASVKSSLTSNLMTSTSSSSSEQRSALPNRPYSSTSSTFIQNFRGPTTANSETMTFSSRPRRRRSDLKTRHDHKNH